MKLRKRQIFVTIFLIIFAIYSYIVLRGSYLEILGIGEKYIEIYKQNIEQKITVFIITFILVYLLTYITTRFIKRGLKHFFVEEKMEVPKLPNKSICLAFATIAGVAISAIITEKALLAFSGRYFVETEPIFNMDIGYYIFQKPFIEAVLYSLTAIMVILFIYIIVYYVLAFSKFFNKGISMETLKNNTFLKQLIAYIFIIIILIAILTVMNVQNIILGKFMTINDGTSLYGAGLIDVTVKKLGYMIFSVFIIICAIILVKRLRQGRFRKAVATFVAIPLYLIVMFSVILCLDIFYLRNNELDKQKDYIGYNIEYTKKAYGIEIDEIDITNTGTITEEDINNNQDVINNVNIFNKERVLVNLEEYQSSLGYYTFNSTQVGLYEIDGTKKLTYISPREILSNDTRTYNNKTYQYTHGYGVIITDASTTAENGGLNYIKSNFIQTTDDINISQPRIYFGLETNDTAVTNIEDEVEYDYPLTSTTNQYNEYDGEAGIQLPFIDRLILGIKTGDLKLAFSSNITKESNIIINRNIIERAETVMPYLKFDEEPYVVVTEEGKLVWVLEAYTVSDSYPYSQVTNLYEENGKMEKINYIRNSVKVIIDSYDGTMKFYITDRTDPIVMAYWSMYPNLFEKEEIPQDISKHFVYPKYLYDIQKDILKQYHNVQPEVLYRADDVWDIAKENTSKVSSLVGTNIEAYYTMVKTVDSDEAELGLVIPYTISGKQNINAYLVGKYNENGEKELKLYKFNSEDAILGTLQLDTLIEQDETISKELESVEVTGTRIEKNIIVVPINNTLLYVEPIYQVLQNENQNAPILKKVIVASGNKVAIGNNLQEALNNLLSQAAVSIKVESANAEDLINEIIEANNNLKQSNQSNNWSLIGQDIEKLQSLITQLETLMQEQALNEKASNIFEQE